MMNMHEQQKQIMEMLMMMLPVIGIFVLLIYVSLWKIFTKAGKPGWAAIIPIYNIIVLLQIVGKPWYWLLLMCIPLLGIIWGIWTYNLLSKSFGKGVGFTLGLIFLSIIFFPV